MTAVRLLMAVNLAFHIYSSGIYEQCVDYDHHKNSQHRTIIIISVMIDQCKNVCLKSLAQ